MIDYFQILLNQKKNNNILEDSTDTIDINDIYEDIDYIPLTSEGILYPNNKNNIKIRKLNFLDENILSKESFYIDNKIWETLINNVLKDDLLTYDDLLPIDVDGILIWLRLTGYGSDYSLNVSCPNCQSKMSSIKWDLKNAFYNSIDEKYIKDLKEYGAIPFIINNKTTLGITIPNMKKIKEVDLFVKQLEKETNLKLNSTKQLLYVISHIEQLDNEENNTVLTTIEDIYIKLHDINLSLKKTKEIKEIAQQINKTLQVKGNYFCKDNLKDENNKDLLNSNGEYVKCNYKEKDIDLIFGRDFFLLNQEETTN